jgi:peptidoglycan/LPS O-acetylase OafA/YrhL
VNIDAEAQAAALAEDLPKRAAIIDYPHDARRMRYRADIDGLRALAVLAVIAFHGFPQAVSGGFVGVDVFFVISGYLVSGLILGEINEGKFSFIGFYRRRILRIFPALSVVLASVAIAGFFLMFPSEYRALGDYISAGAWFVSNIESARKVGYFDGLSSMKPLLHLWSLAVEEQFYIIWPVLLAIAWLKRGAARYVIAGVGAISFAINVLGVSSHPIGTFYLLPSRLWELALGGVLAYRELFHPKQQFFAFSSGNDLATILREGVSWLGFAAIAASVFLIGPATRFPGFVALLPTCGTAALIIGHDSALNRRILSNPQLVWVGLISYPLYLWHWPILSFLRIVAGDNLSTRKILLALVASFVLSWLTYRFIERPLRFGPRKALKAAWLLVVMVALGMAGQVIHRTDGLAAIRSEIFPSLLEESELQWPFISNNACEKRYPSSSELRGWWFCVTNADKPPDVLVLGNSYANDLYPGLVSSDRFAGWTVLSIATCWPTMNVWWESNRGQDRYSPCFGERKLDGEAYLNKLIEDNRSLRFVLMTADWPSFGPTGEWTSPFKISAGRTESDKRTPLATPREIFIDGLEERIAFLEAHAIKVVLVLGRPELPYDTRMCLARPWVGSLRDCKVPEADARNGQQSFENVVRALAERHPALSIFDPYRAFCERGVCDMAPDGHPLLRDGHHLSILGSKILAEHLASWSSINEPGLLKGPN